MRIFQRSSWTGFFLWLLHSQGLISCIYKLLGCIYITLCLLIIRFEDQGPAPIPEDDVLGNNGAYVISGVERFSHPQTPFITTNNDSQPAVA